MKLTCDICKTEDQDLLWDDIHGALGGGYAFLCTRCYLINDGFWNLSGVAMKAEMEMSTNRRTFNRIRKELHNV